MASALADISAKIQKIPPKARLIGFGVIILVIIVLFINFFYIPLTKQIEKLEADISDQRKKIAANDEEIKKLPELRAEVKTLEEQLRLLTLQLPPNSEVSGLLGDIQKLVSQSKLTLTLWRPEKKTGPVKKAPVAKAPVTKGSEKQGAVTVREEDLYEEIPITLQIVGGYHDLALFFDRVSKMTRIVNMLNLKMSGAAMDKKTGALEIKISCTAKTFAAVEKKPDVVPPVAKTKP